MFGVVLLQIALHVGPANALVPVFDYLIDRHTFAEAEYLCLGVVADREDWAIADPPDGVIEAFGDSDRPVVGAAECRMSADGNVHIPTGARAQMYLVERSMISALSGEVWMLYHLEGLLGGHVGCAVLKGPEGWEAICRHSGVF